MTADWRALQGAIDGDVVLPGSPDYESVRKPVMARFEQVRPALTLQTLAQDMERWSRVSAAVPAAAAASSPVDSTAASEP